MVSQTNEQALEDLIERSLIANSRYEKGDSADYDREFAIDKQKFWQSTPLFDSVIVVTDRRILDKQLKDTIQRQFGLSGTDVG